MAATSTQPSYQAPVGYYVWTWFHNWVQASTLPLLLFVTLVQGDVKKIWSGQQAGGGFDVIPMAAPAEQL
jgi:hypothetical protein